jgi:hypothetical protein
MNTSPVKQNLSIAISAVHCFVAVNTAYHYQSDTNPLDHITTVSTYKPSQYTVRNSQNSTFFCVDS